MNSLFIFKDTTEDEEILQIDLTLLGTTEVCKDDHTITLQFTQANMYPIVVDFHSWQDCSSEFLRLTTATQALHDEMNNMEFMFVDVSKDDDE